MVVQFCVLFVNARIGQEAPYTYFKAFSCRRKTRDSSWEATGGIEPTASHTVGECCNQHSKWRISLRNGMFIGAVYIYMQDRAHSCCQTQYYWHSYPKSIQPGAVVIYLWATAIVGPQYSITVALTDSLYNMIFPKSFFNV